MKNIELLNSYINRVVPYAWDDSETWLEFLGKVTQKVNELISASNEYFNIDIENFVTEKLIEWKNDGTLQSLISENIETELAEIAEKTNFNDNILKTQYINVLNPPNGLNALKGNGTNETQADVIAIFEYARDLDGAVILFPRGHYKFNYTINVYDGTSVIGIGKSPVNGYPTILDFRHIDGALPCISMSNASDINLKNFYMFGRDVGGGTDISIEGASRRINIEDIILNTKTTGYGIGVGLWLIVSTWKTIVVVGAGTGFVVGGASTSVTLLNCFANGCGVGYLIMGTYISLISCAADSNTLYGYVIQSASQISLLACGAEGNGRSALVILASSGITITAFRSHNNNANGEAYFSSFADIRNGNKILFSNCKDSEPHASTAYSVNSTEGGVGSEILLIHSDFDKNIHAKIKSKTRIENAFYPSTIASADVGTNAIFVDSEDNLLKFKDRGGTVKTFTTA